MSSREAPPTVRAQTSYERLAHAATNLNTASNQLDDAISVLEAALGQLRLGIPAWAQISGGQHEETWWSRDIGYTQISGQWGIALRTASGDHRFPDDDSETVWPFKEAPQWMRVEAVARIPDLLDKLVKQAEDITKKIRAKTNQAYEFAVIMNAVSEKVGDWRAKLESAMAEIGLCVSAGALADAEVNLIDHKLRVRVAKQHKADLNREQIEKALRHLGHPGLPFSIVFKDAPVIAEQTVEGDNQ